MMGVRLEECRRNRLRGMRRRRRRRRRGQDLRGLLRKGRCGGGGGRKCGIIVEVEPGNNQSGKGL
jgi:hypothetical protein